MTEFKVGDLVTVDKSKRSNSFWWDHVDDNKVYKVAELNLAWNSYFLEGLPFSFNVSWLVPAFKFEIGENVKVGDAIGHVFSREVSYGKLIYIVEFEKQTHELIFTFSSRCYESQIEKYEPVPVLPFVFEIGDNVALTIKPELRIGVICKRRHNKDNNTYYLHQQHQENLSYPEDWLVSYVNNPVLPEEVKPETKKRKPLEVFAKMNEYFDYYWTVDKFDLVVAIREGTTDDENKDEYKHKVEFEIWDTKEAYKWLVKQALKLDKEMGGDFTAWYKGE